MWAQLDARIATGSGLRGAIRVKAADGKCPCERRQLPRVAPDRLHQTEEKSPPLRTLPGLRAAAWGRSRTGSATPAIACPAWVCCLSRSATRERGSSLLVPPPTLAEGARPNPPGGIARNGVDPRANPASRAIGDRQGDSGAGSPSLGKVRQWCRHRRAAQAVAGESPYRLAMGTVEGASGATGKCRVSAVAAAPRRTVILYGA